MNMSTVNRSRVQSLAPAPTSLRVTVHENDHIDS